MSLKDQLKHFILPVVALSAMPFHAQANQPNDASPPAHKIEMPALKYTTLTEAFAGKSFDERRLAEELISQKDWLIRDKENKTKFKTAFLDVESLGEERLQNAGYRTEGESREEITRLVLTGHKNLDTSLSYQEQLDACGFDMLSQIAQGQLDPSKLSEVEFDRLRTQYMYAQWSIEKYPCYERDNYLLGHQVFPEHETFKHVRRMSRDEVAALPTPPKTIINGHDVSHEPYEENIARQAQQILDKEAQTHFHFIQLPTHEF